MEPFTKALEVVAQVMRDGAVTHPDNDWVRCSPEYHLGRAEEHLRLWRDGDQLQDHVSHAANAPADGINLTRAGVIGAPVIGRRPPEFVSRIIVISPLAGRYQDRPSGLHRDDIGFRSPPTAPRAGTITWFLAWRGASDRWLRD